MKSKTKQLKDDSYPVNMNSQERSASDRKKSKKYKNDHNAKRYKAKIGNAHYFADSQDVLTNMLRKHIDSSGWDWDDVIYNHS